MSQHEQSLQTPAPVSRPSWLWRIVRVSFLVGTVVSIAGCVGTYMWLSSLGFFDDHTQRLMIIKNVKQTENTVVFDREGEKIGEFFNFYQVHVPYDEIPKHLVQAIIAIEDRNFFKHPGYDIRGIMRAGLVHLQGRAYSQGASTITQQLVRHFLLHRGKRINRKVLEIRYAAALEKIMTKKEIFERYVNVMFLGNGSYGIGSAAHRYFGKEVKDLRPHESALIAGLFQSPSRYNPARHPKRARKRQIQVLRAMIATKALSGKQAKKVARTRLKYQEYKPLNNTIAPYFIDYVRQEVEAILADTGQKVDGNGLKIYTTLDQKVQKNSQLAFAAHHELLEDASQRTRLVRDKKTKKRYRPAVEAAALTVDPRTGEILAMIGGRDYEKSKFNRTVQAIRSPGSAFKPVLYSLALMRGWKWSDLIFVSPVSVNNYRPHTPHDEFLTETTMLRSFYRSMNTPAVEIGEKLGLKEIVEHAKKLGIRSPVKVEFGTILGSSDATMADMARLYSVFANYGNLVEQIAVTKIVNRQDKVIFEAKKPEERVQRVISPEISYLMVEGMRNVLQRGTGFKSGRFARFAAGKTGTSNNNRDNWFCGITPEQVNVFWVGTDEHEPIFGKETGGNKLALPIWDTYMEERLKTDRPKRFRRPWKVTAAQVHPQFGHRSGDGIQMYFLRGHEPPARDTAREELSKAVEGDNFRDLITH